MSDWRPKLVFKPGFRRHRINGHVFHVRSHNPNGVSSNLTPATTRPRPYDGCIDCGTTSEHLREKIGFPITLSDG